MSLLGMFEPNVVVLPTERDPLLDRLIDLLDEELERRALKKVDDEMPQHWVNLIHVSTHV